MAVVLFYSPFVRRARDVESVMFALKNCGHQVLSLNYVEDCDYTNFIRAHGIDTFSQDFGKPGSPPYFLRHIVFLIGFCWKHKVDFVFSHLDTPNFVASIAQYFLKAKVFICRHHIDEASLYNYNSTSAYRLTNTLSKNVIVVSERAREYMFKVEEVQLKRIKHIDLGYDFELYDKPDSDVVAKLRNRYANRLVLITIGRLTKYKRTEISIELVKALRDRDVEVALLILGDGPARSELEVLVDKYSLRDSVFLLGQVSNVINYVEAADVVVHPSVLESSCVVIKEAGLLCKPVMVCRGIGDFDSYIENGFNGFLLDRDDFQSQALFLILQAAWKDSKIGSYLRASIFRKFDISVVLPEYLKLLSEN